MQGGRGAPWRVAPKGARELPPGEPSPWEGRAYIRISPFLKKSAGASPNVIKLRRERKRSRLNLKN